MWESVCVCVCVNTVCSTHTVQESQKAAEQREEEKRRLEKEHKKAERQLLQRDGKKPFFLKKCECNMTVSSPDPPSKYGKGLPGCIKLSTFWAYKAEFVETNYSENSSLLLHTHSTKHMHKDIHTHTTFPSQPQAHIHTSLYTIPASLSASLQRCRSVWSWLRSTESSRGRGHWTSSSARRGREMLRGTDASYLSRENCDYNNVLFFAYVS